MPASVVYDLSGFRKRLPAVTLIMLWLLSGLLVGTKSLLKLPLAPTGGGSSSDRFGARMSRDWVARRRMPGRGVSQVRPTFQVLASPAVEYRAWRPAISASILPQKLSLSSGTPNSTNTSFTW